MAGKVYDETIQSHPFMGGRGKRQQL